MDKQSQTPESENRRYVRAILLLLLETGRPAVFDPEDSDYEGPVPFCKELDAGVGSVEISQPPWHDREKDDEAVILRSMRDGRGDFDYATFDGSEDEDFKSVFISVHHAFHGQEAGSDAMAWLEAHLPTNE